MDYYSGTNPLMPPFLRTAYSIKCAIANGLLKPGDTVPSTKVLSQLLRLNPMTISRGLQDLNGLGLITNTRGKAYVVVDEAEDLIQYEIERDVKNHVLGYLTKTMRDFNITKTTLNQWIKETQHATK